jgi:hypothetical protein
MSAENAMEVQALRQHENRNPRTIEEGRSLVKHVESLFMPWNIDALVDGFTEDCAVRLASPRCSARRRRENYGDGG